MGFIVCILDELGCWVVINRFYSNFYLNVLIKVIFKYKHWRYLNTFATGLYFLTLMFIAFYILLNLTLGDLYKAFDKHVSIKNYKDYGSFLKLIIDFNYYKINRKGIKKRIRAIINN
jgi:hypothetical protein